MPDSTIPDASTRDGVPLCSCWRLMHILGPEDVLPDHVCTIAMAGSVLRWRYEQGAPLVDETADWPARHVDGRPIMLVVRQRVTEEWNKWLPAHLAGDVNWKLLVLTVRFCRCHKGALMGIDAALRQELHRAAEGDERALGRLLRREGLPDTPGLRAHLWACVVEEPTLAQPVREGMVTTLVFGRQMPGMPGYPLAWGWNEEQRRSWPHLVDARGVPDWFPRGAIELGFGDGNAKTSFDAETPLWSAELHKQAGAIIQAHREWAARWGKSSLPDRRVKARLLGGYGEPMTLSYLEEALHTKYRPTLEKQVKQRRWALEEIITEHLNACYRMVYALRKRQGAPAEVEPGWRDKVRPVLRQHLLGVLARESNVE